MGNIQLPWVKINDYISHCGKIRDSKNFSVELIKKMDSIVPFDSARLYFINDNWTVYDEFLLGTDVQTTRAYHEYYSQIEDGRYSLFGKSLINGNYTYAKNAKARVRDWSDCVADEFITDYVKPLGIKHSFGFNLHDNHNMAKSMFILDRTSKLKFTNAELDTLDVMLTHLDNLHRNFYVTVPEEDCTSKILTKEFPLTPRESEIAELLSRGVSPANISCKLSISTKTVYKHISNIHEKMNVSNRQELIVKLLKG